ncbi:hypothetical protein, partial [Shewanella sp.]|uniref:hypothetical protein n=1 Tax=Shewanella sp. TaxID=50422 RepID=UPI000E99071B
LCLKDSVFQNQSYFQDKTKDTPKENIDPKSALIIFNFKQWEPGKLDPLKDVNKDNIINDGYTLNGEMGLKFYIDSLRSN